MNYLAHMHLAFPHRALMVGNFLADFFNKRKLEDLPHEYQVGVDFHRFIDNYTDSYSNKKEALSLLYDDHGKYAGVVLDVFYDYFLVKHWTLFSRLSLREFESSVYDIFGNEKKKTKEPFLTKFETILSHHWLVKSVKDEAGLMNTFTRIQTRAKFSGNFMNAYETLTEKEDQLEQLFLPFYADLMLACEAFCIENRLEITEQ